MSTNQHAALRVRKKKKNEGRLHKLSLWFTIEIKDLSFELDKSMRK